VAHPGFRLNCLRLRRRQALALLGALGLGSRQLAAFGQVGAFHPRLLVCGGRALGGARQSALAHWAWELARRTSAPARSVPGEVRCDQPALLAEPFAVWAGAGDFPPLTRAEIRRLREFLLLGGLLLVDDSDPENAGFGRAARRELVRILPDVPVVKLEPGRLIYRTFYLLERPVGRVAGPPHLEAMIRGPTAQVLFSSHDLLGALARSGGNEWALPVVPGGEIQRERAIRLAINTAMYLLCSDYKDDAVHAPELMRRRARRRP
jgi:hypothetical protein